MNDDQIKNFIRRAKAYGIRQGLGQLADDFSQEAAIAFVSGRKATIPHLYVDFLRKEYGDTRSPGGRIRSSAMRLGPSLDQPSSEDDSALLHEFIASPGRAAEPVEVAWRSRVAFTGREALIAELIFDCEWSQAEVADALGITEARVSQIVSKRIMKQMECAAFFEERLPEYKDDPEKSLLVIDWIKV